MKGFVPTPAAAVDLMVEKLFQRGAPRPEQRVLDPGSGHGAFVDGIVRYCSLRRLALPTIVAVESDPAHASHLRERFADTREVIVRETDFLTMSSEQYHYVVGNPPYVSIGGLTEAEKALYRQTYVTATGRFDLYLLFFEKALGMLQRSGRLVLITPEKYLYVNTAAPLRRLLSSLRVTELHFCPEDTFGELVTYPLVTVVDSKSPAPECRVTERDGSSRVVSGKLATSSWQPIVRSGAKQTDAPTLIDIAARVSCGVATGADSVFLVPSDRLSDELRPFAHPTLSGRDIRDRALPKSRNMMLVPYLPDGSLRRETELGSLGQYLRREDRYERLVRRTCARRKPWYAFHENPPLREVFRPKLLCKDITEIPFFVIDSEGAILPRHSLYYIVPSDPSILSELAEFLNSKQTVDWLANHCQRAANGFLRLQSHVLKLIPLPGALGKKAIQYSVDLDGSAQRKTA